MKNKNIVVIGGTSGIGKHLVGLLEDQGANVYCFSRSAEGAGRLDVTDKEIELAGLPDQVHGVVYCPGSITLKPFHRLAADDFFKEFDLNVLGAVRVLQACFKNLKAAKGASVVLFSTVAVHTGMSFHTSVASAKGALEGMVRSLAAEWAPLAIRVNAVAPSLTDTPLAGQLLGSQEKKEAAAKRHPLGRVGTPSDIAEAANYLLSERSGWVTGQVINVDGGMSTLR